MTTTHKHQKVESRNEKFTDRTATKIWCETPSDDNPYIASRALCHGYDLIELMQNRSFVDVFYLLFRGELPSVEDSRLLEQLMIGLINPGPRHPATRAAMNAGVGKTNPVHILPIAASVLGGNYLGGGEIEQAIRFFRKHLKKEPQDVANQLLDRQLQDGSENSEENSESVAPGFGQRFGGIDLLADKLAKQLELNSAPESHLIWGIKFAKQLNTQSQGWLNTGVAAAVFADLGFQPKYGGALFQLLGAPGLLAHGLELANKPINAMPFVSDENYILENHALENQVLENHVLKK